MTSTGSLEAQRRLLRLRVLRSEISGLGWAACSGTVSSCSKPHVHPRLLDMKTEAEQLGVDSARFAALLEAAAAALEQLTDFETILKQSRRIVAPLIELVNAPLRAQEDLVAAEPASPEKAKRFLRVFLESEGPFDRACEVAVLLADELPPKVVDALEIDWREERARRPDPELTPVFWSSSLDGSDWDMCARYRAWERFQFPGFDAAFAEVEAEYERVVTNNTCSVHETRTTAYGLWHATRSRRMVQRLAGSLVTAIERVLNAQQGDGSWHLMRLDPPAMSQGEARPVSVPDSRSTALLCATLLRASESERARRAADAGLRWLMGLQRPDGSWADTEGRAKESDFFITAVVIDAIGRTTLPGAARAIRSGQKWLLTRQDPDGNWCDDALPWPGAAVLALEAFEADKRLARVRDDYACTSVGLVSRAEQLAREDTPTARRLAVVAASHALELFLYSVLTLPSINKNVWAEKTQTIGLRTALTTLQGHLQATKVLKPSELIAHRAALEKLQYDRDQVVHKGANVSSQDCAAGVSAAQLFISKYSVELLGFNLLE